MCACGCFLLAAIVAALVYTVMHGMWMAAIGVLVASALIAWFGKKAATGRNSGPK